MKVGEIWRMKSWMEKALIEGLEKVSADITFKPVFPIRFEIFELKNDKVSIKSVGPTHDGMTHVLKNLDRAEFVKEFEKER